MGQVWGWESKEREMNMWSTSHINGFHSGPMYSERQVNICNCSSEHSLGEPWHKPQAWIVTQFTATSMTSRIKAWRILNLCSVPYDKSTPDGSECQLRSRALRKIDTNKRKQTCTLQQNGKTQNCIHVVLKSVEKKKAEWTFRSPDHHQHQCQTNTWVIILAG